VKFCKPIKIIKINHLKYKKNSCEKLRKIIVGCGLAI
jgi:hypothetical protein